jgi:Cys-rich protein (TIGR01571 family)
MYSYFSRHACAHKRTRHEASVTNLFYADLTKYLGKNAEAIGESSTFWAIVGWSPCAAALLRGQIRKKQGIDGQLWQDFLCYCCAPCCTVGQEAMQLESVAYLLDDDDLKRAQTYTKDIART